MNDLDFLLASFGLLFCAGGAIVWFYLRRVKSLHRRLKQRLGDVLNGDLSNRSAITGNGPRSFFKIPLQLKLIVAALLIGSAVCLVMAVMRLETTFIKTSLLFIAIILWIFIAAYAWRHIRSKLPRRRGQTWYEGD